MFEAATEICIVVAEVRLKEDFLLHLEVMPAHPCLQCFLLHLSQVLFILVW